MNFFFLTFFTVNFFLCTWNPASEQYLQCLFWATCHKISNNIQIISFEFFKVHT